MLKAVLPLQPVWARALPATAATSASAATKDRRTRWFMAGPLERLIARGAANRTPAFGGLYANGRLEGKAVAVLRGAEGTCPGDGSGTDPSPGHVPVSPRFQ